MRSSLRVEGSSEWGTLSVTVVLSHRIAARLQSEPEEHQNFTSQAWGPLASWLKRGKGHFLPSLGGTKLLGGLFEGESLEIGPGHHFFLELGQAFHSTPEFSSDFGWVFGLVRPIRHGIGHVILGGWSWFAFDAAGRSCAAERST